MTSLKTSDADYDYCCPSDPNPFGYGTEISLTEQQVEALGLKDNPPKAGSTVGIQAIGIVTMVAQEADASQEGGKVDVRLRIQLTDMEISAPSTNEQTATSLYGG